MNDKSQRTGCLGVLFKLLGIAASGSSPTGSGGQTELPYKLRDQFLSPAELTFYRVLEQDVGNRYAINNKVRLWDVLTVPRSDGSRKFENKISSKHIDFLLCDPTMMQPILASELDDASHNRADRQQRDDFVDQAFAAAGLPILHVPAARTYAIADVQQQIATTIPSTATTAATPPPIPRHPPTAPRVRTATPRWSSAKPPKANTPANASGPAATIPGAAKSSALIER